MNAFFTTLWAFDNLGVFLGLILNSLLFMAIVKTTDQRIRHFSYLALSMSVSDIFYSLVEGATQHQLLIRNGMFLVMPHGVESFLGPWSYSVFMWLHSAVVMQSLLILPALCHYRYKLKTFKAGTDMFIVIRNVAISASLSVVLGLCLACGVEQAKRRGYTYYRRFVNPEWFDSDGSTLFKYACDMRDLGTVVYFAGGFFLAIIGVIMAGYYSLKAWKTVNSQDASERTKELQRQFTRTLVAQTINAAVFAIFPATVASTTMQGGIDVHAAGAVVMSQVSWLPSANALLAIYLIKAYRRYVLHVLGIHRRKIQDGLAVSTLKNAPPYYHNYTGQHSRS
uniref:G_PROTEIN_RECEP_F1_2 domain-containing protein n=1 Tax=Bursaphelenchus xylophilus TaxID=6326 RepID=A0A1I7SUW8_BURXY